MASGIKGKVAIIGTGCTQFGERWDKSFVDHAQTGGADMAWAYRKVGDPAQYRFVDRLGRGAGG